MTTRIIRSLSRMALASLALACSSVAAKPTPLPVEDFSKIPAIQSVSMSADGKRLVAIIASPGSNYTETALANWDLENFKATPTSVTPSGDRMKFIAAPRPLSPRPT